MSGRFKVLPFFGLWITGSYWMFSTNSGGGGCLARGLKKLLRFLRGNFFAYHKPTKILKSDVFSATIKTTENTLMPVLAVSSGIITDVHSIGFPANSLE